MIIKTLTRGQAQEAMKDWIKNYPSLPYIDDELLTIREEIQKMNSQVRAEMDEKGIIKRDYYLDYRLGLLIYEYLSNQKGFSLRVASNDAFWRYLSVKIVPDVVAQRWGKDNDSHFWSQPSRIWLRSLWWFVHLSWQGNVIDTEKVLSSKHFTTDTILNFEERTGRNGTYIDAYRQIIRLYSLVSEEDLRNNTRNKAKNSDDLFRVVMKLNTARMMVMDPALYEGGELEYARSLFRDAGVNIDVT